MSFNFRKPKKLRAEINIVNLIDIIFTINIFLLVTTSFTATQANAIDVNLPATTQAKVLKADEKKTLSVTIDKMEKIYLGSEKITIEKLRDIFAEKHMLSQRVDLVVSADAMCSHGRIVEVLDLAKKYGITNLSIATKNLSGEKNARKTTALAN
ncbi:MAG TPA: biopolymer transporter ExbD [Candidatus Wallbacteria bacterium]|nr:MAG: biopolymer transport protein ExbD [bacterium ADurb.Bin243]HOD40475.1 biopolymer transporter ExbD [Candidatus Wallbacteria bacterium]HPG57202.1 biopolymer transporter ExbD [Candidatus Wallbacteria bacterium]